MDLNKLLDLTISIIIGVDFTITMGVLCVGFIVEFIEK